MTFDYTPRVTDYGIVFEPLVSIVFINPITYTRIELLCLIDSGAEETLITAEAAHELGLTLDTGQKRLYRGVGQDPQDPIVGQFFLRETRLLTRLFEHDPNFELGIA